MGIRRFAGTRAYPPCKLFQTGSDKSVKGFKVSLLYFSLRFSPSLSLFFSYFLLFKKFSYVRISRVEESWMLLALGIDPEDDGADVDANKKKRKYKRKNKGEENEEKARGHGLNPLIDNFRSAGWF